MISPTSLLANKVQVHHTVQAPGDFIVTFPQAYHAGFSHGWNMAEACNFALPEWLPFGRKAMERYRLPATLRSPALSHEQLVANLARWCRDRDHPLSARTVIADEMRRVVEMEDRERQALAAEGAFARIAIW
jgi:histone demethylase JARID1